MSTEKQKKGLRLLKFHKKIDNASLKLSQLWNGDQMPYSLKSCFAFIYYHNIDAKHVLRKNGNKVAHEVLCSYLKKNIDVAPTFYLSSVYDVCSAVKAYVKDIPNGLLDKDLENDWHKIVRLHNEAKVKEKLMNVIHKLPMANKSLLFHLLFLASAVTKQRCNNEMSTKSLSIVLMPSMFERVVDIMKVRDLNGFYDLLEFMIDNAVSVVGKEIYTKIESSLTVIGRGLLIVQQITDEPTKTEEDKQVQFASQDSGLNSTSFIDDKGSQSLSSLSRSTNNNVDQNNSSMEDLLNTSDNVSGIVKKQHSRQSIFRSSTIVKHQSPFLSEDSSYSVLDESRDSHLSVCLSLSSSTEDISLSRADGANRRIKQRVNKGLTCIGLKVHSIKECRPYSICGSPSLGHISRDGHNVHVSSANLYSPVYDRSFQILDRICDDHVSPCDQSTDDCQASNGANILRKKAVIKRSLCVVGPLQRLSNYQDNPNHVVSASVTTKQPSIYESENVLSPFSLPSPNLSKAKRAHSFLIQKLRIKKKPSFFRSRLSVPIKAGETEAPVDASTKVMRTVSLEQSPKKPVPLPRPLDTFLRQRSADETFV